MSRCRVELLVNPDALVAHLNQVFTGFYELAVTNRIELSLKLDLTAPRSSFALLSVRVNDSTRVIYDLQDGYNFCVNGVNEYISYMTSLLNETDYYFKRSFSPRYNAPLPHQEKMHPLGLNYAVTSKRNQLARLVLRKTLRRLKIRDIFAQVPLVGELLGIRQCTEESFTVERFEHAPQRTGMPKILFMARAWDPCDGTPPGSLQHAPPDEERSYINEMRAQCIRLCRRKYPKQFYGCLAPDEYAREHFPDCLPDNPHLSRRDRYLTTMQASDICIATMGLHQSIGWKFAEYLAASKAIVSERLHYVLPGNLCKGRNYLEFTTPEECVEQVGRLVDDPEFRYRMMELNQLYYQQYVRPDQLVLNSLNTIADLCVT